MPKNKKGQSSKPLWLYVFWPFITHIIVSGLSVLSILLWYPYVVTIKLQQENHSSKNQHNKSSFLLSKESTPRWFTKNTRHYKI